jgi:cytochrome c553
LSHEAFPAQLPAASCTDDRVRRPGCRCAKAAPKGDAARGQAVASTVCAACHGPDGNSPAAANPKLAGQHPEYLYKQMNNFKAADGKQPERTNARS